MNKNEKEKFKKLLLLTFQAFDRVCKENNLTYYAAFGTALGAVRHKGLIPWDDDIDVMMPRKDYEKLMSLKGTLGSDYDIINMDNDGYFLNYAKFHNIETTILPSFELPIVYGVFVDVFALDESDGKIDTIKKECKEYEKQLLLYFKSVRNHTFTFLWNCLVNQNYKVAVKTLSNILYYQFLKQKSKNKINELEAKFQQISGPYYCRYSMTAKYTYIFPKEWFGNGIRVPFEDTTIIIPQNYDQYLKTNYGNYMKLPPVEKRVSGHPYDYMNLNQRLSYDEILKRIK